MSALAASGLTTYYYIQVSDRVASVTSGLALASIGTGLWLAAGGCALALVLALAKPSTP